MRSIKNMKSETPLKPNTGSFDKYDGLNGNELMSELMKNVAASKSDGTFSPEQLDEFVSFVSPSLDAQSRERLIELVGMIKGV